MNVEMQRAVPAEGDFGQARSPPPPGMARIGELEVLRTVAILMVLAQHVPINLLFWPSRYTLPVFHSGTWSGVDLFFAVSGFVIARGLLPQLEDISDVRAFLHVAIPFWIRRAWRLWPSAWFWLLAPLVLCVVFNQAGAYGSLLVNWWMAVAGFANLANFYVILHPAVHGSHGTAFAQWSLSLEEQFYLILPFAALLFRRYLAMVMGAVVLLAFVLPITPVLIVTRSGAIAAGVLLAIASRHPAYADCAPVFLLQNRLLRIFLLLGCVAMLVSFGDLTWIIVPFFFGPIAVICGLLVWVASYDQGYLWRPGWARRVMEVVAARSYSIYLVHIPVFFGMHEAWFRLHGMVNPDRPQAAAYFAIAALLVAAVAELNHCILERPLRARGKQIAKRVAKQYTLRRLEVTP